MDENKKKSFWQFVKFLLVGVSNTIISYAAYSLCYHLLHTNVHVANVTGFVISVFTAFLLQNRFVFKEQEAKEKRVWWKVLLKTYMAYAFTGLFLTEVWFVFWLNLVKLQNYMGPIAGLIARFGLHMENYDIAASLIPIINIVFNTPINFCINKFWAYRQKDIE